MADDSSPNPFDDDRPLKSKGDRRWLLIVGIVALVLWALIWSETVGFGNREEIRLANRIGRLVAVLVGGGALYAFLNWRSKRSRK